MQATVTAEQVIASGGGRWAQRDLHRVYLDPDVVLGLAGYTFTLDEEDRAQWSDPTGRPVPGATARQIEGQLKFGKFYLDVPTGTWHVGLLTPDLVSAVEGGISQGKVPPRTPWRTTGEGDANGKYAPAGKAQAPAPSYSPATSLEDIPF